VSDAKKLDTNALVEVALNVLQEDAGKYADLGAEALVRLRPVAELIVHAAERRAAKHPDAGRDLEYAQAHWDIIVAIYAKKTSRQGQKTMMRIIEVIVGTLAGVLLRGLAA